MITGKNEFGNLISADLSTIQKVLKTQYNFQITLKSGKVLYLTDINNVQLLLKFTGMPLVKRRFVGSYNYLGKLKYEESKKRQKLERTEEDYKEQKHKRNEEVDTYHI